MFVSLQGKTYIARVSAGAPGAFRYVGNVPDGNYGLSMQIDRYLHNESETGQRLQDARVITGKQATMNIALEDWSPKNLALALYGTDSEIAAGSMAAPYNFPNPVAVGDYVRANHQNLSNVVIKDSAGSPATLVAGTDYEITSAEHGLIKILNLGSYTQPFKFDSYDYGAIENINMFTNIDDEYWVMFAGVDSIEGNDPQLIELYRVVFDPISDMPLKHAEIGRLPLQASVLYDETKAADATLGQFGRIALL